MMSEVKITEIDPLAVRPAQAARLIGVSLRTFATMRSCGQLPPALKIRGCLLYRVTDLRLWLEWNCPNLERFEAMKKEGGS